MEKVINGKTIHLNEEGYLTNFLEWEPAVAESLAQEEGIELSARHWEVLKFLQKQHHNKTPLTIRMVGKSGVVTIKDFYELFPKGPLKQSTKIAGIPKPISCI